MKLPHRGKVYTQQIRTGQAHSSGTVTVCQAAHCNSTLYRRHSRGLTHLATGTQPGALHGAPPTDPSMAHLPTPMSATQQRLATGAVTVEVALTAGQGLGFCATVAADSG